MPAQSDLFFLPASQALCSGRPLQTYPRYQAEVMAEVCHGENTKVGTAHTATWWGLLLFQDMKLRRQSTVKKNTPLYMGHSWQSRSQVAFARVHN